MVLHTRSIAGELYSVRVELIVILTQPLVWYCCPFPNSRLLNPSVTESVQLFEWNEMNVELKSQLLIL